MTEEDLKKAIQGRIQREREAILEQANKEAEQILKLAQDEASSLRNGYLLELKKTCFLKKTKEISQINLEAQKLLLEDKEKNISEVFVRVHNAFKTIRKDKNRYKEIFKNLLQETQEGLGKDSKVKIKVNPADREIALEVLKELKINAQIETKESIGSGLELCDLEENISIINTFESRLEKLMPELREEISKILFGE